MASMGAYIFTWLIGYSGLMGAIAGIMICDYWVLRGRRLDLAALFDPSGRYAYSRGWNWRAVAAMAIAIAPALPGFVRAATTEGGQVPDPGPLDTLYTFAWFVTFLADANESLVFTLGTALEDIYLLVDYKGHFGSKHGAIPYRSGLVKEKLSDQFARWGYRTVFLNFCDVNFQSGQLRNQFVLFTSSEDRGLHYKSFIEDVVLGLEIGGAHVHFECARA